jgi:hypothetical protein
MNTKKDTPAFPPISNNDSFAVRDEILKSRKLLIVVFAMLIAVSANSQYIKKVFAQLSQEEQTRQIEQQAMEKAHQVAQRTANLYHPFLMCYIDYHDER